MRGQRSLFGDYIPEKEKKTGRGRDSELIAIRDKVLTYRYFYYNEVKRMRYDDALERLSEDFFIAEPTIISRLQKCNDMLTELFKERPTIEEIKEVCCAFSFEISKEEECKYYNK